MTTKTHITDRYNLANLEAATIIASNPTLYPEGGLMQRWARLVQAKSAPTIKGPLFQMRAA